MSEFKEVVSNWVKFTAIDDYIQGTLIGSELKRGTDPQGRPQEQLVYEILTDEGKFHTMIKKDGVKVVDKDNPVVVGKGEYYNAAKASIDNAMKKIKVGQKVKLIFTDVIESKDKMKNDFKLVKVYAGEMDEEWIKANANNAYQEISVGNTTITGREVEEDEIKVENIPFAD